MKAAILPLLLSVIVNQSLAQTATVTLRPHFNGKESVILWSDSTAIGWTGSSVQYYTSTPDSVSQELAYLYWTNTGIEVSERSFIKFTDLTNPSIIPAGSTILSATLYLYGIPSSPYGNYGNSTFPGSPYNMYGEDSGWLYVLAASFPNAVTWNTQPGILYLNSALIPPSTTQWNDDVTIDVTSLVTYLYTHGNNGFAMRLNTAAIFRARLFGSSRYPDSTKHPSLVVTYHHSGVGVTPVNQAPEVTLYPNPVSSQLHARIVTTANNAATIGVFNMLGQKMYEMQKSLITGSNTVNIPVEYLASGIYFLEVSNENGVIKQKFIKQ